MWGPGDETGSERRTKTGQVKCRFTPFTQSTLKGQLYYIFRAPLHFAHSHVCKAFKVYSTPDKHGWKLSTYAVQ